MATLAYKHRPPSLKIVDNGRFDSVSDSPLFSPTVPPSVKTKLHHWPSREVANELCVMDAELIRSIKPEELEGGAWMKEDKVNMKPEFIYS